MRLHKKSDLDDVQDRAIDYLFENSSALALCPTGSGKTVIAMTALDELMEQFYLRRPLIFAPLRVSQLVWPYEAQQWEHLQDFKMAVMAGAPDAWPESAWLHELLYKSRSLYGKRVAAERAANNTEDAGRKREKVALAEELLKDERKVNKELRRSTLPEVAHVTSYENLDWLLNIYKPGKLPFDAIVLDEIGKLKNPKSPRAKLMRKHTVPMVKNDQMVWGLNATPAPEGLQDLFMQVTIVDGGVLWGRSFYRWRDDHFKPADYQGYRWIPMPTMQDKILTDLNTVAFKIDSKDLPYQKQIKFRVIPIELPPEAREKYDDMAETFAVDVGAKGDIVALSEAAKSMKLRQILQGFVYDEDGQGHILHREKQHALADLIESMNGEPLLVAYDFREDLTAIQEIYPGLRYLGHGVSASEASKTVEMWNDRKLKVMAVHPLSASHGLNLQYGGSNICWFYTPWPLDSFQQTNERLDRRGQTQACFGHMITALDTLEGLIADRLQWKDVTQKDIIEAVHSV